MRLWHDSRRTKIVATLGPATSSVETVTELIEAGANVLRLNFSHGTREEHTRRIATVREAAELAHREVAILGDLPGPKIRLGEVAGGSVDLVAGAGVRLTDGEGRGGAELAVALPGLARALRPGNRVLIADGVVQLGVRELTDDGAHCVVEAGGRVGSRQGVNLPDAGSVLPAAGLADLEWVDFAVAKGIDLLAVSFVRNPGDVEAVLERVRRAGGDTPVIAKLERGEAAERVDEIAKAANGVMVARGDLGIDVPLERVPQLQREVLTRAGAAARTSITATQMLASMVVHSRPTRAEASDVANAIHQGTDAVMLSEETAVGAHPVEAVRFMDRIARVTEADLPYADWSVSRVDVDPGDVAGSLARAAVGATRTLGLRALVVPTASGRTARLVAAHRPQVPVLAVSPRRETVRRLNLVFGVQPYLASDWDELEDLMDDCALLAHAAGVADSGELIGITAGLPRQKLGTNLFEVHRVP